MRSLTCYMWAAPRAALGAVPGLPGLAGLAGTGMLRFHNNARRNNTLADALA